ncbi:MAG: carbohydrate kinase family protein [Gaiella sp.]
MVVVSLGDLTLDVIVRLQGLLAARADTTSEITLRTGGQGANVAAWVAALGGRARWLGVRVDDDAGRLAARGLQDLGVELVGPLVDGRTGVVVSLVEPGGERSMLSDRGSATGLAPEALRAEWLRCDHLHLSGYALFAEPSRSAALRAFGLARAAGARISVDLASWSGLRETGAAELRRLLVELEPDAVLANEDEERELGGAWDGPMWILKHGAAGCTFAGVHHDAHPVEVVDSTGAGDALAAGWILGGPTLGLQAAARCVARVGSMP